MCPLQEKKHLDLQERGHHGLLTQRLRDNDQYENTRKHTKKKIHVLK